MLRSYAFSGRRRVILVALSISYLSLVSYVVWVVSRELSCSSANCLLLDLYSNVSRNPVTALFLIKESSGCFATSNQPIKGSLRVVGAYQLGVSARLYLWCLTGDIDCKQVISVRDCLSTRCCIA